MKFHSPPILRVQSCLTDAVVVIFLDYCFTDTHLIPGGLFLHLLTSRFKDQGTSTGRDSIMKLPFAS